jgi:hypothetical protein
MRDDIAILEIIRSSPQSTFIIFLQNNQAWIVEADNPVLLFELSKRIIIDMQYIPTDLLNETWRSLNYRYSSYKKIEAGFRLRNPQDPKWTLPYIQWAFLDLAPLLDSDDWYAALETCRANTAELTTKSHPIYALHLMWLGQKVDIQYRQISFKFLSKSPFQFACSFLEELDLKSDLNFRENFLHWTATKVDRYAKYWNFLLSLESTNVYSDYRFKRRKLGQILSRVDYFRKIAHFDESPIGQFLRFTMTPSVKFTKRKNRKVEFESPNLVIVSGQLRFYQAGISSIDLLKRYFLNLEFSTVVSTWVDTGRKAADNPEHLAISFSGPILVLLRQIWFRIGTLGMNQKYPSLFSISGETRIDVDQIVRVFKADKENVLVDDDNPKLINNPERMYFRWWRVKDHTQGYSQVWRIRPDTILDFSMVSNSDSWIHKIYQSKMILIDNFVWKFHRIGLVCGDSVAVGLSNSMNVYLKSWDAKPNRNYYYGAPNEWVPHANLASNALINNINLNVLPIGVGIERNNQANELKNRTELVSDIQRRLDLGIFDEDDQNILKEIKSSH